MLSLCKTKFNVDLEELTKQSLPSSLTLAYILVPLPFRPPNVIHPVNIIGAKIAQVSLYDS